MNSADEAGPPCQDTPRTNAIVKEIAAQEPGCDGIDWISFARQLERELADRHRIAADYETKYKTVRDELTAVNQAAENIAREADADAKAFQTRIDKLERELSEAKANNAQWEKRMRAMAKSGLSIDLAAAIRHLDAALQQEKGDATCASKKPKLTTSQMPSASTGAAISSNPIVSAFTVANVHVEHYFPKGYDTRSEPWISISKHCRQLERKLADAKFKIDIRTADLNKVTALISSSSSRFDRDAWTSPEEREQLVAERDKLRGALQEMLDQYGDKQEIGWRKRLHDSVRNALATEKGK